MTQLRAKDGQSPAPGAPAANQADAMGPRHWVALLATASMFGSTFLFINIAVAEVPPVTLAAGRALLAAPIAWAFLRMAGLRLPRPGKEWGPLIVLGILTGVIPYTTIAWGQVHIASGLAGILFGAIPIFSVVLAPIFLREEKFSAAQIAGAGVGFAGVVLVIGPQALTGVGDQLLGTLITLLAALSYTLGAIYSRTRRDLSPVVMTAGQLITASAVLVPVSLIVDAPWTLSPSSAALGAVAWTAVIGTAAPVLLLFWLIRNAGAVSASLMTFFMPVVAVALGAAALGEALPWQAFAGLGLILLGAAAVSGRLKFGRSRPTPRAATRT